MVAALMTKGQQWKLCLTNGQEDLHLWTSPGLTNEEIAASFGAPSGGRPTEG